MIRRFWAWLTGGRVVWLLDFNGVQTRSIGYPGPHGAMTARRMLGVEVTLLPGGRVIGRDYVTHWTYEKAVNAR